MYNMGQPRCLSVVFLVDPSCKHFTWYVVGIIPDELELSQKLEVVVYLGHPVLLSTLCAPNIIEIYFVVCGSYLYTPTSKGWQSVYGLAFGMAVYMVWGWGCLCIWATLCCLCVCAAFSPTSGTDGPAPPATQAEETQDTTVRPI